MSNIHDFLEVLETESKSTLKVDISSKDKPIDVVPLSFKQQKLLITSGMNGIVGIMSFIKNLNEIIIENTGLDDLKIYDRIPIILALRKKISSKKLKKEDVEVDIEEFFKQFKKYPLEQETIVKGNKFEIYLKVPTLKEENKYISTCIEDLKKVDEQNIGKNVSLILSYEIPKFIDKIKFEDNIIKMSDLTSGEKNKLIDNIPADITNEITDYILSVREYDEQLLTYNGVSFEIDYSFFE